jgi:7-cyano-7-deazaguanine reductase
MAVSDPSFLSQRGEGMKKARRGPLETIPNPFPERDYEIEVECTEFTCLCPEKPDQPDFATFKILYVPDRSLIELKSLKLYLTSYRNREIYHEAATNQILEDLVAACQPRRMTIVGNWNIRGGIRTRVTAEYRK